MSYIITGATGNIGRRVVGRLLEAGIRPRVLTRDAEKARKSYGEHVDIRVGDLSDPASLRPAFNGGSTLFLVNAGPDLAARDAAAVQVARAVGVTRVMKLSSLDVGAGPLPSGGLGWFVRRRERGGSPSSIPTTSPRSRHMRCFGGITRGRHCVSPGRRR